MSNFGAQLNQKEFYYQTESLCQAYPISGGIKFPKVISGVVCALLWGRA